MIVSSSSLIKQNGSAGATAKRGPPLSADIQARIGRKLLEVYDEVLSQPVPDRFLQLLNALDEKTKPQSPATDKKSDGS
ncbi:MAG: hypothetical protein KGQ46_03115 [Hyphomicrobiales bacterium]|nr:hypothetical protein [Hyphomicrobiales bacterium]MDE2115961.1 hypothetical protein [Hyphomicrobiales bacterium]